jgi:electron-transferring-flavoprotein dehydrogenase
MKHHPMVRSLLEGGEILSTGARAIVEGGYQALPVTEMPGAILIGDAAGLLNVPKVKGTHQAMRSGMLAAGTHNNGGGGRGILQRFDALLRNSAVVKELHKVRNVRPAFYKGCGAAFSPLP